MTRKTSFQLLLAVLLLTSVYGTLGCLKVACADPCENGAYLDELGCETCHCIIPLRNELGKLDADISLIVSESALSMEEVKTWTLIEIVERVAGVNKDIFLDHHPGLKSDLAYIVSIPFHEVLWCYNLEPNQGVNQLVNVIITKDTSVAAIFSKWREVPGSEVYVAPSNKTALQKLCPALEYAYAEYYRNYIALVASNYLGVSESEFVSLNLAFDNKLSPLFVQYFIANSKKDTGRMSENLGKIKDLLHLALRKLDFRLYMQKTGEVESVVATRTIFHIILTTFPSQISYGALERLYTQVASNESFIAFLKVPLNQVAPALNVSLSILMSMSWEKIYSSILTAEQAILQLSDTPMILGAYYAGIVGLDVILERNVLDLLLVIYKASKDTIGTYFGYSKEELAFLSSTSVSKLFSGFGAAVRLQHMSPRFVGTLIKSNPASIYSEYHKMISIMAYVKLDDLVKIYGISNDDLANKSVAELWIRYQGRSTTEYPIYGTATLTSAYLDGKYADLRKFGVSIEDYSLEQLRIMMMAPASCAEACLGVYEPVCGSDGLTYTSLCHLNKALCRSIGSRLAVVSNGQCPASRCDSYNCQMGYVPVCGTDRVTYDNICELELAACRTDNSSLKALFYGACYKEALCKIEYNCSGSTYMPVCGSDLKTYMNYCSLQLASCISPDNRVRLERNGTCVNDCSDGVRLVNCSVDPCQNARCDAYPEGLCVPNHCGGCNADFFVQKRLVNCSTSCSLKYSCSSVYNPVCGSDRKLYGNPCLLNLASCERPDSKLTEIDLGNCRPACPLLNCANNCSGVVLLDDDDCSSCRCGAPLLNDVRNLYVPVKDLVQISNLVLEDILARRPFMWLFDQLAGIDEITMLNRSISTASLNSYFNAALSRHVFWCFDLNAEMSLDRMLQTIISKDASAQSIDSKLKALVGAAKYVDALSRDSLRTLCPALEKAYATFYSDVVAGQISSMGGMSIRDVVSVDKVFGGNFSALFSSYLVSKAVNDQVGIQQASDGLRQLVTQVLLQLNVTSYANRNNMSDSQILKVSLANVLADEVGLPYNITYSALKVMLFGEKEKYMAFVSSSFETLAAALNVSYSRILGMTWGEIQILVDRYGLPAEKAFNEPMIFAAYKVGITGFDRVMGYTIFDMWKAVTGQTAEFLQLYFGPSQATVRFMQQAPMGFKLQVFGNPRRLQHLPLALLSKLTDLNRSTFTALFLSHWTLLMRNELGISEDMYAMPDDELLNRAISDLWNWYAGVDVTEYSLILPNATGLRGFIYGNYSTLEARKNVSVRDYDFFQAAKMIMNIESPEVCADPCSDELPEEFCGSDGLTYGSKCSIDNSICRTTGAIKIDHVGACRVCREPPCSSTCQHGQKTDLYGCKTCECNSAPDVDECEKGTHNCHANATCENKPNGFSCVCKTGYSGNGTVCTDIDECFVGNANCHRDAVCKNLDGSFVCSCKSGFSGNGTFCEDINECNIEGSCNVYATCINSNGTFTCTCQQNYTGDGKTCALIDFCGQETRNCHSNAVCQNVLGGFICVCKAGFTGNGTVCTDIDECQSGSANCHRDALCKNLNGSFVCSCKSGFTGNGTNCEDINECNIEGTCNKYATCINSNGTFTCTCQQNYTGDGQTCALIDFCGQETRNCHSNAVCQNVLGGFLCVCKAGYSGNGTACTDIDECQSGSANRHSDAVCKNLDGSFACSCKSGFSGNGTNCQDIDECTVGTHNCHANATCQNTVGGFSCVCKTGYSGNGTTCTDIDECRSGTTHCHTSADCKNLDGSFVCSCKSGFSGNGTNCKDINECLVSPCHSNATCVNSDGSYACACKENYAGDGRTCIPIDIDECTVGTHNCHANATCQNTVGGFNCVCKTGYSGNGTTCTDIDECQSGSANCHSSAVCKNLDGSFACSCKSGFSGNGTHCEDVDECRTGIANCHKSAVCRNLDGSFTCLCIPGFSGNGTSCEDIDHCLTTVCHRDATCVDGLLFATCACKPGYSGNGVTCVDIDECATPSKCGNYSTCSNSIGSYSCTCPSGYVFGSQNQCVNKDECKEAPCSSYANCVDTVGSYQCSCKPGFTGNGQTCANIDECLLSPCSASATCVDTVGSYDCRCGNGLGGDGRSCFDFCANSSCPPNSRCRHTLSGHICVCNSGYAYDPSKARGNSCLKGVKILMTKMRFNHTWSAYLADSQSREFATKSEQISFALDEVLKQAGVVGGAQVSKLTPGSVVADLNIVLLSSSRNVTADQLAFILKNVAGSNNASSINVDPMFQLLVSDGDMCTVDPGRCGSNAKCTPVGAADFFCFCNDGYEVKNGVCTKEDDDDRVKIIVPVVVLGVTFLVVLLVIVAYVTRRKSSGKVQVTGGQEKRGFELKDDFQYKGNV